MKLKIKCIGQKSESNLGHEIKKYHNRISSPFSLDIEIFPHSKHKDKKIQKQEEAKAMLKKIPDNALLIATEINGKNYTTEELRDITNSHENCVIFIGGCNGLDASITNLCKLHWSISRLTLPHTLVRLIVVEQWYRINCLNKNHPYHK